MLWLWLCMLGLGVLGAFLSWIFPFSSDEPEAELSLLEEDEDAQAMMDLLLLDEEEELF